MNNNTTMCIYILGKSAVSITAIIAGVYILINGNHYTLCACSFVLAFFLMEFKIEWKGD